jgi:sarcosine oxidase subunit alpha
MFRRLPDIAASEVTITIDGAPVRVRADDTVAAALLVASDAPCRTTPVGGTPRAPYCMMGACFDCLVVIDGVGNRQACLTPVREGMVVERQLGRREVQR